jgi:hypothetical protein
MKTFLATVLAAGLFFQGLGAAVPEGSAPFPPRKGQTPQVTTGPAEYQVSRLAHRMRARRGFAGPFCLATGAISVGGGIAMLGSEDDFLGINQAFGTIGVIGGGLAMVGGIVTLAAPSPVEKADTRIRAIADGAEREREAADLLAGLARKGKRNRMILGGTGLAAAALAVAFVGERGSSGSYLTAAVFATSTAWAFLVKSPEEKAYRAYREGSGPRTVPDLVLGLTPHGGIVAGLSFTF